MIKPGSGWPGDLARRSTPVAHSDDDVVRLAGNAPTLDHLSGRVSVCRACPRLVEWREQVARDKRTAFAAEDYWGRPVPGWGDPKARIAIVGLAPAAHGANRTGRIFTGDRSGDWLFAALHRAGLARVATSVTADDGQALWHTRILSAVRCAPPANKPTARERDTCRPWMDQELSMLAPTLRVVLALGGFGWSAVWPSLAAAGWPTPPARTSFGHGAEVVLGSGKGGAQQLLVLGSYHPSQQNTFTGRLTESMLDDIFHRAKEYAGL